MTSPLPLKKILGSAAEKILTNPAVTPMSIAGLFFLRLQHCGPDCSVLAAPRQRFGRRMSPWGEGLEPKQSVYRTRPINEGRSSAAAPQ
jgi:hypothetical protein